MAKRRLDMLLVERGLAESREAAQRLIRAGHVCVKDQLADKPGHRFDSDSKIHCKETSRFVGRGGEKLQGAFDAFNLNVEGLVCLDVGASTGGFTDCLLQHGAQSVYAVDVGKGQLHWKLRSDPRVTVLEKVNARYLEPGAFDPIPQFACVDVSFISLTKILPAVIRVVEGDASIVTLIKPQFEAGRDEVGKGGVVRDGAIRQEVVARVRRFGESELGMAWHGVTESPLRGPAGNVEFLALWSATTKAATGVDNEGTIE